MGALSVQLRLFALVALACVLYVVASLAAAGVRLDAATLSLVVVAGLSALTPAWLQRSSGAPVDLAAGRRVAWLGLAISLALVARLSVRTSWLLGEVVTSLALPIVGLLLFQQARELPDHPRPLARHRWLSPLCLLLATASAAVGVAAVAPELLPSERGFVVPRAWSIAPLAFLSGCGLLALGLRFARRVLGSDARARAANQWATLGTATASGALALWGGLAWTPWRDHAGRPALIALAAGACLLGHVWMVTPARVEQAAANFRALLALLLAGGVASAVGLTTVRLDALPVPGVLILALVTFLLARAWFAKLVARALMPSRGALLAAIEEARVAAHESPDYETLVRGVLKPLRRAAGLPEAAPLLATFDPLRTAQLDGAGFARLHDRALPRAVVQRLEERPGAPLVRSDLRNQLARRPQEAALVRGLDELDALCVLPLQLAGELEGALVVAAGARRAAPTLEELMALERLARILSPLVAGFLALARAQNRAERAEAEQRELAHRVAEQHSDIAALRHQVTTVKAGLGLPLPVRDPIQYSRAMRELRERLGDVAVTDLPVLLWGETGLAMAPIAQAVHRASGRAREPFVIVDGAELDEDTGLARLFGVDGRGEAKPGLLELIEGGTLLIVDLPALPLSVQQVLAETLEERQVRPLHGQSNRPFQGRVIATARASAARLSAANVLVPALARWFETASHRVPPLRERPEDFESSLLLALDRTARVLGANVKGVEADALAALVAYDWPGNDSELFSVIERASLRCTGPRLRLIDLPPLPCGGATAERRTFVEQEREILRRALRQAAGNRARAARALSLTRAAFNEKLRQLQIDDPAAVDN